MESSKTRPTQKKWNTASVVYENQAAEPRLTEQETKITARQQQRNISTAVAETLRERRRQHHQK